MGAARGEEGGMGAARGRGGDESSEGGGNGSSEGGGDGSSEGGGDGSSEEGITCSPLPIYLTQLTHKHTHTGR